MDWSDVRAQFPGLADRTFLDAACVSLIPSTAEEAVRRFAEELVRPSHRNASEHHLWMDGTREEATGHVAELLGVSSRNVALVESTTHGLNIAAQAIPWREGDEVVMCDLEFLQVAIPFVQLAKTHGVRPVFLEHEAGVVPASAYAGAINERTRAVVLSSTQWCNGYRVDLEAVAEACRAHGVWLVVDAVQQAGALPVSTSGVDFLLAGGHKWLNAPMGTGFAALSDRVLEELQPASWGYLNLNAPDGGWVNYFTTPTITPDREYAFTDSAKRFEIGGTANYPGAVCLSEALRVTNEVGVAQSAERIWALGERLQEGLRRLDVRLETPFERENRAGIITFHTGSRERDAACLERLLSEGISVSQRYTSGVGGVRVSLHYYNNEDDVDGLLGVVGAWLRG
ncbi:MAG: aminotransferase class V-fold PLP-dependent enzyme [Chloroflexi bacterium]|nr:aminotransferase class V-fold PLP-dependent enzyme [Chloroflexota bacterium]